MVWGYGDIETGRMGRVGIGYVGREVGTVERLSCGRGFDGEWVEGVAGEKGKEEKGNGWKEGTMISLDGGLSQSINDITVDIVYILGIPL